jgi:hypothetical protein
MGGKERMKVTPARTVRVAVVACLAWAFSLWAAADDSIPFPLDFREWAHVKSAIVGPQSPAFATEGGLHHVYANRQALAGYRAGAFPDGSILVYDLLETREAGGLTSEGPERRVDVMVKDRRRYGDTGGWGFASFKSGDRTNGGLDAGRKGACVSCHGKQKDRDYVFSEFRK